MISFEEMTLSPEMLRAVKDMGFDTPTPIQEKVIPAIFNTPNDIIGLAQTGTGKTAAFGLPMLQQADTSNRDIQALILCPTRELCMQVASDLEVYAMHLKNFRITAVYGGASIQGQIKELKQGTNFVVGTPGRVLDMIRRSVLKISKINWLVLDEADEMLNMGFKDDLEEILIVTPPNRRTLLFSATMPNEIAQIASKYMKDAVEISVGKKNAGAEMVKHEYYVASARDRYEVLKRIADINPQIYGIVFCRTRQETKEVADKLMTDGYNADALHGDLSQAQRDHVMNRFRAGTIQLLVATDVAARGLDVSDLTHIINYNLPDELEIYIHRSGRTGRAGKSGVSISITHSKDTKKIRDLEKLVGKKFELKQIPGGREICEKQLFNLIDKVEQIEIDETQIAPFLSVIFKKLSWLERDELIKRFVSVEFNRFLNYYKDSQDLNLVKPGRTDKDRVAVENFTRFFINVGSTNKLTAQRLMGMINEFTRNRHIRIGRIDIMRNFSFFEVDKQFENDILQSFKKEEFEGVRLVVEVSKPSNAPNSEDGRKDKPKDHKRKMFKNSRKDNYQRPKKDDYPGSKKVEHQRAGKEDYKRPKKEEGRRKRKYN